MLSISSVSRWVQLSASGVHGTVGCSSCRRIIRRSLIPRSFDPAESTCTSGLSCAPKLTLPRTYATFMARVHLRWPWNGSLVKFQIGFCLSPISRVRARIGLRQSSQPLEALTSAHPLNVQRRTECACAACTLIYPRELATSGPLSQQVY